ncbi:hypothetical protein E2C01_074197 [Portunus trituberculatus]|uniref:Uncharacterized protein n=1 Tax=Portunus trituberculatus TaxID=210409 RepID=A0A5B7I533_PORTR|nr:hypothetical protein [Portunus trituberculatus]
MRVSEYKPMNKSQSRRPFEGDTQLRLRQRHLARSLINVDLPLATQTHRPLHYPPLAILSRQ